MKKTLLLLTVVAGLFATGCLKIETTKGGNAAGGTGNTALSNTESKLVGKWRNTYYKSFNVFDGVVQAPIDVLALTAAADSCVVDDLTDFRSDRSYYRDQRNTPCFPNSPQELRGGTWRIINNDQDLLFAADSGGTSAKWRILSLTSSRLELYADSTILDPNGQVGLSSKVLVVYEK